MTEETFSTSSGKEITVHIGDDGEPHSVSWIDGEGKHTLSENEVLEISEWLEDYDSDPDGDNDDDDESDSSASESNELT